jgi:serine protease Do
MKGLWRTTLVAGLALAILAVGAQAAAPFVKDKTKRDLELEQVFDLPSALSRSAPESVSDLKAIQDHVKKVIKKVTPAVVGIQIGGSAGSGVIIDADGLVLTAGHVSGKPGTDCRLVLADGKIVKGKSLGQNKRMDSGMIRITDKGTYPYVKMSDSSKLKISDWVLSIGHPGGYKPTRKTVVRVGRVMKNEESLIQTDCTLVGGDSGGPMFDMQGRVIGIHSRIGLPITENVHVPINAFKNDWDRLVKGDSWPTISLPFFGNTPPANSAYLGVVFDRDSKELKIDEVTEDSPADKAGLKAGDVIVSIDDSKLKTRREMSEFMAKKKPGDEVTLLIRRGGEEMKLKVKLGKRPD